VAAQSAAAATGDVEQVDLTAAGAPTA
jgi:hypothetical protein